MSIKTKFKCRIPNANVVAPNGDTIPFAGGEYLTDNPVHIEYLMKEIVYEGADKSKHPHLYVDTDDKLVDTTLQDRIAEAQRLAAAKILAESANPEAAKAAQEARIAKQDQENVKLVNNTAELVSGIANAPTSLQPNQLAVLAAAKLTGGSGLNAMSSASVAGMAVGSNTR